MKNKALSKKVFISLFAISCVSLGGIYLLNTAEAGEYIVHSAFRPHGNPLVVYWSEFERLETIGAPDSEWRIWRNRL